MKQAIEDAFIWLRYAAEDLQTAQSLMSQDNVVPRHPAWLAQQAAEKAIKALLIAEQIRFPWTHDLDLLFDRIPDSLPVKMIHVNLSRLSEYAVNARYPGDLADVSSEGAQIAVADANKIVEAVRVDLTRRFVG